MISLKSTPNNFNLSDETLNKILKFMCGRIDFYWEYKNGVPFMIKEQLFPEKLNLHFLGGNALGFSSFITNDTIMFLGWDFDAHTSEELNEEENNRLVESAQQDAQKVYDYLKSLGLTVIQNSSGSKGRHVRLFCEGANSKQMRVYGHYILWKLFGDHNKHEVFPKQDCLSEATPFGNQMKGYLCVHPKKKQRANVILNGKILDFESSIKVIKEELKNPLYEVNISKEDYDTVESLMKNKTPNYNQDNFSFDFKQKQNSIHYCKFIEEVATKKVLPSSGKYSRHPCIDPNIQAYSYFSPEAKKQYAIVQGRHSDTAFRNWEHYWEDGKPTIKCGQIIGYLKHHQNNVACIEGLNCCKQCQYFKEFIGEVQTPKGWANSINIKRMAEKHNFLNCWVCDKPFQFNEKMGWYSCECGNRGGLVKFAEAIIKARGITI